MTVMTSKHIEIILETLADKIDQQNFYIGLLERDLEELKELRKEIKEDGEPV